MQHNSGGKGLYSGQPPSIPAEALRRSIRMERRIWHHQRASRPAGWRTWQSLRYICRVEPKGRSKIAESATNGMCPWQPSLNPARALAWHCQTAATTVNKAECRWKRATGLRTTSRLSGLAGLERCPAWPAPPECDVPPTHNVQTDGHEHNSSTKAHLRIIKDDPESSRDCQFGRAHLKHVRPHATSTAFDVPGNGVDGN